MMKSTMYIYYYFYIHVCIFIASVFRMLILGNEPILMYRNKVCSNHGEQQSAVSTSVRPFTAMINLSAHSVKGNRGLCLFKRMNVFVWQKEMSFFYYVKPAMACLVLPRYLFWRLDIASVCTLYFEIFVHSWSVLFLFLNIFSFFFCYVCI